MAVEASILTVFAAAMVTALATGLGALPFLFVKTLDRFWISIANAMAGGLMLAATHSLVAEGIDAFAGAAHFWIVAGVGRNRRGETLAR